MFQIKFAKNFFMAHYFFSTSPRLNHFTAPASLMLPPVYKRPAVDHGKPGLATEAYFFEMTRS